MESIMFRYTFKDEDGQVADKDVELYLHDKDGEGVNACTVCEMFEDFMESAGFSINSVLDYFR